LWYPHIKQGGKGPRPPNLQNASRKFQKNDAQQVWKIMIFDRQTALFNGASMGASTYGFSEVCQLN
jgi:hypothetical protein